MKIVLDTNVLLVSIPSTSRHHPIFESLLFGKYKLLLTTEIYVEYYEIISIRGKESSLHSFEKLVLESDNIQLVEVAFNWNLILADPDDNKFVDCALAGSADYLVTNDNHFNIVKKLSFPVVNIISPEDFLAILEHGA